MDRVREAGSGDTRDFEFTYRVDIFGASETIAMWLPIAHDDGYQTVYTVAVESPVGYTVHQEPVHGNRIAHMVLPPEREGRHVALRFQLQRRERISPTPRPVPYEAPIEATPEARFLTSSDRTPIDDQFSATAARIASPDQAPLVRARAVFDHLLDTLEYDAGGCTFERYSELGDLERALRIGRGTCTEFHGLYAAYARALGLPVRIAFGFSVPRTESMGQIHGYHCWAEVYLPEVGWFPVDVTQAHKAKAPAARDYYFGNLDPDRVQFTRGQDIELTPSYDGEPVASFIFPVARFQDARGDSIPLFPSFEFSVRPD